MGFCWSALIGDADSTFLGLCHIWRNALVKTQLLFIGIRTSSTIMQPV